MKTFKKYILCILMGIIGYGCEYEMTYEGDIEYCIADPDGNLKCQDLCPEDDNKTHPGVCGCGVSDTDDNNKNGIPDCLDNDIDLCPEDDNKLHPGICGCGLSDDANGVKDSDGDKTPNCLDKCPNDGNKTEPGICGCGIIDSKTNIKDSNQNGLPDCLDEKIDLCPEDDNKTLPGVCGCGVSDTDDNNKNGIPDCLDNDIDLCPEDDNKTLPGVCGCGVSEEDSDSDGIPNCIDKCPNDSKKTTQGQCGCNVEDSPRNIQDSDSDGIINCLDPCPNNYRVFAEGVACDAVDTDGDGVTDDTDVCPTNPNIPNLDSALGINDYNVNCKHVIDHEIHVYHGQDLFRLASYVNDKDTKAEDHYHTFYIHGRINLADVHELVSNANEIYSISESKCDISDYIFKKNDYFSNKLIMGDDAVIVYEKDGSRCKLKHPLFTELIDVNISNLKLDFDMNDTAQAALTNKVTGGNWKNITYSGTIESIKEGNAVGGIAAEAKDVNWENTCLEDVEIDAVDAKSVGGLVGRLSGNSNINNMNCINSVKNVTGKHQVGGYIGYMTAGKTDNTGKDSKITIKNISLNAQDIKAAETSDNKQTFCGGFVGITDGVVSIQNVRFKANTVTSEAHYAGGFVGYISNGYDRDDNKDEQGQLYKGETIFENIQSEVNFVTAKKSTAGGFAGRFYVSPINLPVTFKNIASYAQNVTADHWAGGFMGTMRYDNDDYSENTDNIKHTFKNISSVALVKGIHKNDDSDNASTAAGFINRITHVDPKHSFIDIANVVSLAKVKHDTEDKWTHLLFEILQSHKADKDFNISKMNIENLYYHNLNNEGTCPFKECPANTDNNLNNINSFNNEEVQTLTAHLNNIEGTKWEIKEISWDNTTYQTPVLLPTYPMY